jgi:hypothetical protein
MSPVLAHHYHQIIRRVRRAHVHQVEMHPTEHEGRVAVQPAVGRKELGVFVHPGRERLAALREAVLRHVAFEIFTGRFVGPHLGAGRLECGKPIEVVGVVMGDDHAAYRRIAHAAYGGEQGRAQCRRAQRIDHDYTLRRDDEAGIGDVPLVCGGGGIGLPLHVPDVLADAHRLDADRFRRLGRAGEKRARTDD